MPNMIAILFYLGFAVALTATFAVSMALHEVGHALVARLVGWRVWAFHFGLFTVDLEQKRLIGGDWTVQALIEPTDRRPGHWLAVSLAGVTFNAAIGLAAYRMFGWPTGLWAGGGLLDGALEGVAAAMFFLNIAAVVGNLLPMEQSDGARAVATLRALWRKRTITRRTASEKPTNDRSM